MEQRGKCKASKRPYMKLFTSDYRDGTAQLSFEVQGFYIRILTYLNDGDTVPSDPSQLARFLQCNTRTVRKLLPPLLASGKLFADGFALKNPRIERELEANSTGIHAEFDANSSAKIQKDELNQHGSETHYGVSHCHSHSHSQKEETLAAAVELEPAALPPEVSCDELEAKLWKAAGPCLADPVNAQGLITMAVPRMWLAEGADLELDVIETLKAQAAKHRGKKIQTWNYFTRAIAEAMARRKAGLPAVEVSANPKTTTDAKVAGAIRAREALERVKASMGANA